MMLKGHEGIFHSENVHFPSGNAIIILTIFRSSRLCTRAYNILIAQLAVADLIVGK